MEARFAGSQRVGDRRRRRLAVGADDNADNLGRPSELSAPAASFRAVDGAHADGLQTEPSMSLHLAVAKVIPAEGWKYLVGGLLALALGASLIIAGCFASELQTLAGPGISNLFAHSNGRVAQWFSSLLLLLCAQLALLIWWTRSRSLEDFDGRYWLWIRTACVWLVLSGCVSVGAHNVALDTVLSIRPGLSREWANLCWIVPAAALGALLVGALVREMRGCRASCCLLLLACAGHLSTAGLHLELESFFSPVLRVVLIQVGLLIGHVALFVSMWLHARHVLYCSADPAPLSRRTWRIPRPHFRLPHFQLPHFQLPHFQLPHFQLPQWRSLQAGQDRGKAFESQAPPEGPKSRRKRPITPAAAEIVSQGVSESIPIDFAAPSTGSTSKPRIRFDSRHLESSQTTAPEDASPSQKDAGGRQNSSNQHSPNAIGSPNIGPAESVAPAGENVAEMATCRDESADPDEASEEGLSKPELRGLSKKQRRRMMQELRERESRR